MSNETTEMAMERRYAYQAWICATCDGHLLELDHGGHRCETCGYDFDHGASSFRTRSTTRSTSKRSAWTKRGAAMATLADDLYRVCRSFIVDQVGEDMGQPMSSQAWQLVELLLPVAEEHAYFESLDSEDAAICNASIGIAGMRSPTLEKGS